jgi:hypothetical protein
MSDQIILKSVGSFMQGSMVGALMSNGLPDLMKESIHFEDLDIEWIESLSDEDRKTFAHQVSYFEIELTQEQKNSLYGKKG